MWASSYAAVIARRQALDWSTATLVVEPAAE